MSVDGKKEENILYPFYPEDLYLKSGLSDSAYIRLNTMSNAFSRDHVGSHSVSFTYTYVVGRKTVNIRFKHIRYLNIRRKKLDVFSRNAYFSKNAIQKIVSCPTTQSTRTHKQHTNF